jgi:restriction system protein
MMWTVRAGEHGRLFEEFRKKSIVAIGWNELGDLSSLKGSDQVKGLLAQKFPNKKPGWLGMSTSQVGRFRFDMKKGDWVVTYNPESREYLVGKIEGDYDFNPEEMEYHHTRKVKWQGSVSRDSLTATTKNTLGAISTLFQVGAESEKEIVQLLSEGVRTPETITEEPELEAIREDMKEKAAENIKDMILRLDWDEVQELVAGLLRAMGYKTIVSPVGADRGADVRASPDALGMQDPRIVVEVKHREASIGRQQVASFITGIRPGNKGLYVSTGGFSKDAKFEAERAPQPVTLVDLDMLVSLIIQYYDAFDNEARALIPLHKIYWPA